MLSKHTCGDLEKHLHMINKKPQLTLQFRVHIKASHYFSKNEILQGPRTKQYTETIAGERTNHRHCTLDYYRRETFTGLQDIII